MAGFTAVKVHEGRPDQAASLIRQSARAHLHALHERRKAPEGLRLVAHDVQNGRRQIGHALRAEFGCLFRLAAMHLLYFAPRCNADW